MSSITPNGVIELFRNCPIDKDYNHTLYFNSIVSQNAYFSNLSQYKKVFTNQMYQRAGKNSLRVQEKADNVLNYNYMRFMNSTPEYAGKWFYAFIDSIDYINENVCQVNYTLDVMQTWYFDYELGDCFVEREHTESDEYGENLVAENLNVGDKTVMSSSNYFYPRPHDIATFVVLALYTATTKTVTAEYNPSTGLYTFGEAPITDVDKGNLVNGIYNGVVALAIPIRNGNDQQQALNRINLNQMLIALQDANVNIVSLVQIPYSVWENWSTGSSSSDEITMPLTPAFRNPNGTTSYAPKNRKLYSSPYHSLLVSNNDGTTRDYDWEQFKDMTSIKFNIEAVPYMQAEIMMYPKDYKGVSKFYEEGITLTNFPMCTWNEDSFKTWWQQNKSVYASSLISTAVNGVMGMGIGTETVPDPKVINGIYEPSNTREKIALENPERGGTLATNILGSLATLTMHRDTKHPLNGQPSLMGLRVNQGRIGFTMYQMGVTADVAKAIDTYFTMFGYAIKQVKVPNVRNENATLRPHWNYIKTSSVIIHGATNKGLPAEDEDLISKIYNKGITFWMHADEIGDYSLDNSPAI